MPPLYDILIHNVTTFLYYGLLEWTVVVSSEKLKRRKEEKREDRVKSPRTDRWDPRTLYNDANEIAYEILKEEGRNVIPCLRNAGLCLFSRDSVFLVFRKMGAYRHWLDTPEAMTNFREMYGIPEDVRTWLDKLEDLFDGFVFPDGWMPFPLIAIVEGGVRFPVYPLLRACLSAWHLSPCQLMPNGYK
ncbi:hypothetical protein CKAN_02279200 [Cinnamomum micranthum f. kanehirae]|uniref:Uncharacterized protein n=1 Tax=Cinnamomum micranthum f. kanehirae TaxID=337451 RepID=A0A443PS39_9MAGN|nr:hypothetical protein CKAN_02279200 [Cinnamomum micranthum f. kanehirae]